jgi:hypothetical protein
VKVPKTLIVHRRLVAIMSYQSRPTCDTVAMGWGDGRGRQYNASCRFCRQPLLFGVVPHATNCIADLFCSPLRRNRCPQSVQMGARCETVEQWSNW